MNPTPELPKSVFVGQPSELISLFREGVGSLFPNAAPVDRMEENLKYPDSFLLRDGENLLWVEIFLVPFSRTEIPGYLSKACEIQSGFPGNICGIIVAPDFEAGIHELLAMIRIPVRFFQYRQGLSVGATGRVALASNLALSSVPSRAPLSQSTLWIEEIAPLPLEKSAAPISEEEKPLTPSFQRKPLPSGNSLSREELREFIQFELDTASRQYNA